MYHELRKRGTGVTLRNVVREWLDLPLRVGREPVPACSANPFSVKPGRHGVLRFPEHKNSMVRRREYVKAIWRNECSRLGALCCQ
jgi:hypothetical protein